MPDTINKIPSGGDGEITDYLHADFDDLIFERRNKAYGGYVLRKKYPRRLLLSCLLAISIFLAAIYAPDIFRWLANSYASDDHLTVTEVNLSEPPAPEVFLPPPPSPANAQPKPLPLPEAPQKVQKDELVQEPALPPAEEVNPPEPATQPEDTAQAEEQTPPAPANSQPQEPMKALLEHMPAFPSGQDSLFRYFYRHIVYPQTAREKGVEGVVIVKFIIEKDGSVTNVQAVNDIGGGCTQEAVRVVKRMPKWIPGKVRGQPVKVQLRLPVEFRLTEE